MRGLLLWGEITDDGLMGQCAEGDRSDELLARGRDDDLHLGPALDESADDQTGLIRRDGACDAQYDFLSF